MSAVPTSPFLHVANGSSVTMTMEAAGIPGTRSIWADPLHAGPVPAGVGDAELVQLRAEYLGPSDDPAHDIRRWRAPIERHDSYGELVLWFEHDLFDQLNLIQLLTWLPTRLPPAKPVSLICVDSFPGQPDFKGLGELRPEQLAALLPARQPVTDAQYALAARAWHAFREPTPVPLDELRRRDTSALPYLAAALARFLQEYPWLHDGLSRSERRLLELADNGAVLSKVFPRMHDGERAYYVTDVSLMEMVANLSACTPPLVTMTPSGPGGEALTGTVRLAEAGRAALAGRFDRVRTCGLDRWMGGVHLQGHGPLWRWDDAGQRVTVA